MKYSNRVFGNFSTDLGIRISYALQAKGHPVGWLFCLWKIRGHWASDQNTASDSSGGKALSLLTMMDCQFYIMTSHLILETFIFRRFYNRCEKPQFITIA